MKNTVTAVFAFVVIFLNFIFLSSGQENIELIGIQELEEVTLQQRSKPYILKGLYQVPLDRTLVIDAGCQFHAEKDAELSIEGTLFIKGTKEKPVIFVGKATGRGYWKGIKLEKSTSSIISYLHVEGAQAGIYIHNAKPKISASEFTKNTIGIKVGDYGSGGEPTIENCSIVNNTEHGVYLSGSSAKLKNCNISSNKGWGIFGEFYTSPTLDSTIITNNEQGGIFCHMYSAKPEAHNCIIYRNGKCDVKNGVSDDWDFSKNYWGEYNTKVLNDKGNTANLPSIADGHDTNGGGKVVLIDFLMSPPKNCGPFASIDSIEFSSRTPETATKTNNAQIVTVYFKTNSYIFLDPTLMNPFYKALTEGKKEKVSEYLKTDKVFYININTTALLIDYNNIIAKVKMLSGTSKDKEGWVLRNVLDILK